MQRSYGGLNAIAGKKLLLLLRRFDLVELNRVDTSNVLGTGERMVNAAQKSTLLGAT